MLIDNSNNTTTYLSRFLLLLHVVKIIYLSTFKHQPTLLHLACKLLHSQVGRGYQQASRLFPLRDLVILLKLASMLAGPIPYLCVRTTS